MLNIITFFLLLALLFPTLMYAKTTPGSRPYPAELQAALKKNLSAKGSEYKPRTEHFTADGQPHYTNRLILEDSPYLLQHAHNPVDWYPWGDEAFETARRENRPIFLSIGYATCHWCHVMERESFEDLSIATYLNEHFISIKVDREQRPDVDDIYMTAVTLYTGHGGWPMSSFLTHNRKPFYGGTYFPPQAFLNLLQQIQDAWHAQREALDQQADNMAAAVGQIKQASGTALTLSETITKKAITDIISGYDSHNGGFSGAPKFPNEPLLLFLLDALERNKDAQTLAMVEHTLSQMARGGIYDQIGGGFHRYSTDDQWLVPHFEKMLYNQAHLARAYLQAYHITGKPLYARTANQILNYVVREMTTPEGAFYSATDADSEGAEGTFFTWTFEQVEDALDKQDAQFATTLFGMTANGNFEGSNIPYLNDTLANHAKKLDISSSDLLDKLDSIRETLRLTRDKREHPLRDDKIIVAWNGMMISTLAQAASILDNPSFLAAAEAAGEFLWDKQWQTEGPLLRTQLNGKASIPATQDDYAYFCQALIALHDATGKQHWLERAMQTADAMEQTFWDARQGGFYMSKDSAELFVRPKSTADGAEPSGNAIAIQALARLAKRTGNAHYETLAKRTVSALSEAINQHPNAYAYLLLGLSELLHGELGPMQYGARGKLKINAMEQGDAQERTVTLTLQMADGWHINGPKLAQPDLIATQLSLGKDTPWKINNIHYPPPQQKALAFLDAPLALYEGEVHLKIKLMRQEKHPDSSAHLIPIELRFQACSDETCLAPETLLLTVSPRRHIH